MTLEQLEQFCRDYDRQYGSWPESKYEGWSLLTYIKLRLAGVTAPRTTHSGWPELPEDWPEGQEMTGQENDGTYFPGEHPGRDLRKQAEARPQAGERDMRPEAGIPDHAVIAAVRAALWEYLDGRDLGEDRSLVGMVKRLGEQRDEARRNRAGEFELRMKAEAEARPLGFGYPTVNTRVFCAHCEGGFDVCPKCGRDEWRIERKSPSPTPEP